MSCFDPSTGDGRPADCRATCPHFEPVSGSCGHDLRQAIASAFREQSGSECPIYGAD